MTAAAAKQWQPGDSARVTFGGRTVDAVIELVVEGRAVAVTFDALLADCAGFMALLWDADGEQYIELFSRDPVGLAEAILPAEAEAD